MNKLIIKNKIGFNASLTSFNDISKFKVANFIFEISIIFHPI